MNAGGRAALIGVSIYALGFHALYWARDRFDWARRTVDWLGRISRHGPEVVLIWALIADMLAVVFLVVWLTDLD